MKNYFKTNLVFLRKKATKTQADIGLILNKKGNTVGYWEKGEFEPSMSELEKIAQFFDIGLLDLLYADLSKGKAFEKEEISKNPEKGKLKGKPIGKLNDKNGGGGSPLEQSDAGCAECKKKDELIQQKDILIRALNSTLKAQEDTISALKQAQKLLEERVPEKQPLRRKAG